jgi:hypothetical protein
MTKDEALKLALEALEPFSTPHWAGTGVDKANAAITAIKEALAQPAQEPVAWMFLDDLKSIETTDAYADAYSIEMVIPYQSETVWLYTAPPLAQPAQEPTDIAALVKGMEVSIDVSTGEHDARHRLFGTVTLAQENQGSKHGLILLVQEPTPNFKVSLVQEPVAWGVFEGNLHDMFFSREDAEYMAYLKGSPAEVRPLYTAPQQRPWEGLTDTELMKCTEFKCFTYDPPYINKDGAKHVGDIEVSLRRTYENINNKLKEKNT